LLRSSTTLLVVATANCYFPAIVSCDRQHSPSRATGEQSIHNTILMPIHFLPVHSLPIRRPFLLFVLFLLAVPVVARSQVKIDVKDDRVSVEINGKPFTSLYKGEEAHKPYFYPVLSASGKPVTRAFPMEKVEGDPMDHPHQRSLWIGAEQVSGMDFWENETSYTRPRKGSIVFRRVLEAKSGRKTGSFRVLADWVSPEGKTIITEILGVKFYATPKDSRMFDIDLRLTAMETVKFDDDHDAILGLRLAPAFDERKGGKVVDAEGITGADTIRGKPTAWVDWQTDLQGEQVGVAVMDSPHNFRYPTPWHLRPEGIFFAAPFAFRTYSKSAKDGSVTLQPGEKLHLLYRIFIHPANVAVAPVFKDFSKQNLPK
jgi:hypothetical protein